MTVSLSDKELWKGVIQYGKNMSTYKMGVGRLLIKYANDNLEKISLDDMAQDFYNMYEKRIANGQRQNKSSGKNTYVEQEIWSVTAGNTKESSAYDNVKKKALIDMVLPRFNSIHGKKIPFPFYENDERILKLNDNLLNLFSTRENNYLDDYVVGRWGMLEHAFTERDFAQSLTLDEKLEHFLHRTKRTNIAKFSDVLCAYQNDRCFYCEKEIYDKNQVDHVIPRKTTEHDEVWNLVLAHQMCNQEKSDKIPSKRFVEKLIKRNEDVMQSDHPLKEKMKLDIGNTPELRRKKVEEALKFAEKWNLGIFDGTANNIEDEFLYNKIVRWSESNH